MKKKFKIWQLLLIFVLILVVISGGLLEYNRILESDLSELACRTLQEVIQQQKQTFSSEIRNKIVVLDTLAAVLDDGTVSSAQVKDNVLDAIKNSIKESSFDYIVFADTNGYGVVHDGRKIDLNKEEFYNKDSIYDTYITSPFIFSLNNQKMTAISTPVNINGKLQGTLIGLTEPAKLRDLFFPSFRGLGYAYIIDSKGNVITKTNSQYLSERSNVLEALSEAEMMEKDDYDTIVKKLEQGDSGHAVYALDGEVRLMHFSPLGINDWYVVSIAPESTISEVALAINSRAIMLTILIVGLFIILLIFLLFTQKRYADDLYKIAYYNQVTNAPNSIKFYEIAGKILQENKTDSYAIAKIGISKFNLINEIYSYETGNEVLRLFANSLANVTEGNNETYGQIFGDRFLILIKIKERQDVFEKIKHFEQLFALEIKNIVEHKVIFPTGIYLLDKGETDVPRTVEKAAYAHRVAKEFVRIGDNIKFYDEEMRRATIIEKEIEDKMETALHNGEFKLYLQSKHSTTNEELEGAEALVRWQINEEQVMNPGEFIPILEKNGFVVKIDMYIFEQVCIFLQDLIEDGNKPFTISVNFSRLHLINENFVAELTEIADKYNIPHEYLEIEITETSILDNELQLKKVLKQLHSNNFTLAMDDFGAGYSSLGLLKYLKIDIIKIDRSFFSNTEDISKEEIVVKCIVDMAKSLNMITVAEGVETKEHIEMLKRIGCDLIQGFYYSKPMYYVDFYKKHFGDKNHKRK